jgi:cytoskeletal protein CcmA (bactofilin family)
VIAVERSFVSGAEVWAKGIPRTRSKRANPSLTLHLPPFIVAGVLKKFIPQKPGQMLPVEDAGSGENPPIPPGAAPKTVNQPTSVMADTPNKNNLSKDVEIKGSIKFANEFVFDGNLEGEISSVDGILTVGENADVRGEVKSKTVIVKGKVHGNITVQERCELHSRSQLIGDLKAARLGAPR